MYMLQRVVEVVRQKDVSSVYQYSYVFWIEHTLRFSAPLYRPPANQPKMSFWKIHLNGRYIGKSHLVLREWRDWPPQSRVALCAPPTETII